MTARLRTLAFLGAALAGLAGCADSRESEVETAIASTLRETAATAERGYDHAAAAAHYRRLHEREPKDTTTLVGLARNLRVSGSPKEAIRVLKDNIEKLGEKGELLLELGKAQLAASLLHDARESLVRAQAALPENWQAYAAMGVLYDRLDDHENATAEYRKALKLSPNNLSVLNNMALSLAQAGKLDEGISILEKAAHGERSTMQIRQNLALLFGLKGQFELAERLLREDLPPEMAVENMSQLRQFHY
jgi:Flp pilus assembly protein TadD